MHLKMENNFIRTILKLEQYPLLKKILYLALLSFIKISLTFLKDIGFKLIVWTHIKMTFYWHVFCENLNIYKVLYWNFMNLQKSGVKLFRLNEPNLISGILWVTIWTILEWKILHEGFNEFLIKVQWFSFQQILVFSI